MNKDWSEQNKKMQQLLKKGTFADGIQELLSLRQTLIQAALSWRQELRPEDYCAMPYRNADGYHSKTIAYSLWHIFRIEDIVVNTLIRNTPQLFFSGSFQDLTQSPMITTGNELILDEIADFSRQLNLDGLYTYCLAVQQQTDAWLQTLEYPDLKTAFGPDDRSRLLECGCINPGENAVWLVDYWSSKTIKGLIQMPLSRHWIMHIEASIRIRDKLLSHTN